MTSWHKLRVSRQATILATMELIEKNASQFAIVTDNENRLEGTVTDGDIRRGILRGVSLEKSVAEVMNAQPRTAESNLGSAALLKMMRAEKIGQMPVVDGENKVIDVVSLAEILARRKRDNGVVLMAGGLGTRLGSLTKDCPKPLLKIEQKPILEIILAKLREHGFHRFYISVNYKSEMIEDYFQDGDAFGVSIEYLREKRKMGTAGSLSLFDGAREKPFLVMNGDILTKTDFSKVMDFHDEGGNDATMCVRRYEMKVPYGVVHTDGEVIAGIDEKPIHSFFVNAGVYIFNPKILSLIPISEPYDMDQLFRDLIAKNFKSGVFPIHEYWLDVGQRHDFEKAKGEYRREFS